MFTFRIAFPPFSIGRKPRKPRVTEDMFSRRLDGSRMLQHMCGFDTELYDAINGLKS